MIAIGEYFVIAPCHGITRTYLCIGEGPAQGNPASDQPGKEKDKRCAGPCRCDNGSPEDPHADHQAHDDHNQVEKIQLFITHILLPLLKIINILFYLSISPWGLWSNLGPGEIH